MPPLALVIRGSNLKEAFVLSFGLSGIILTTVCPRPQVLRRLFYYMHYYKYEVLYGRTLILDGGFAHPSSLPISSKLMRCYPAFILPHIACKFSFLKQG